MLPQILGGLTATCKNGQNDGLHVAILTNYCYPSQKCKRRHVVSTWRIRWKTQPLRGHQSRPSSNRTPPHCFLPSHQLLLPAAWLKVTPARLKMPRTHLSAVQESPYPRDMFQAPRGCLTWRLAHTQPSSASSALRGRDSSFISRCSLSSHFSIFQSKPVPESV